MQTFHSRCHQVAMRFVNTICMYSEINCGRLALVDNLYITDAKFGIFEQCKFFQRSAYFPGELRWGQGCFVLRRNFFLRQNYAYYWTKLPFIPSKEILLNEVFGFDIKLHTWTKLNFNSCSIGHALVLLRMCWIYSPKWTKCSRKYLFWTAFD